MGLSALAIIGLLGVVKTLNDRVLVPVASNGGTLTEGIVGTPRFINPLLAVSDVDRDLSALVYSGLLRPGPAGKLIPDLAETYSITPDGLTYTFILKKNLTWQDGKKLTTTDVEFTIEKAQDSRLKSVRRAGWEGVKIKRVSDREIRFELKQPYATFLDVTTMGILPKHLWQDLDAETFTLNELNIKGVGSGPYRIKTVKKNREGIPLYYEFEPFKDFALGQPKLSLIITRFYANENDLLAAFRRGEVESLAAISPTTAETIATSGTRVERAPLPRVFGVFLNQSEAPIFTNQEIRQALNLTVPRQKIITEVLKGYGEAINGPLPPGVLGYQSSGNPEAIDLAAATALLEKSGWKKNDRGRWEKKNKKQTTPLAFRLATASSQELKTAAEILVGAWREFGAEVTLEVFEIGDLNQNVIRPRKYEALFFGEIIGTNPDPFAFWHSSQRLDPGLNVALYANAAVDKLLTEARLLAAPADRAEKLAAFATVIRQDTPAIFIYSPSFIYVLPDRLKGITLSSLTTPADRFANIDQWYVKTEKVWPLFVSDLTR